jgi:septal ring factor EnvC (AmiA/AmiB activator)
VRGRCRRLTAAMTAVCAGALVVTLSPTASADPDPGFPSAEQVEKAKQAEAAKNGEVGAIEAQLAQADQLLEQLDLQVAAAVEAYLEAVYQLQMAEQEAADTAVRAQEADAAVETARDELGRFASASYRMGGDLAFLSALLDAKGPKGLADQASALDNVASQRGRSYDRFRGTKIAADVLRTLAAEALAEQQRATDLVRTSKEKAERELANQQAQVDAIEQQKSSLLAQLAELRNTSVRLERERQEGLAREAARRAAEEAARRAADEARRRAEAAATAASGRSSQSSVPAESSGSGCSGGSLSGYANGRIPSSSLCPLWGTRGHRLRSDAAAAYNEMSQAYAAHFGSPICITDSYRSYDSQVILKRIKGFLAARPGTSQHGWGLAVDLCGGIQSYSSAQHKWMRSNAPDFGFDLPSWARQNGSKPEPWHWEYGG